MNFVPHDAFTVVSAETLTAGSIAYIPKQQNWVLRIADENAGQLALMLSGTDAFNLYEAATLSDYSALLLPGARLELDLASAREARFESGTVGSALSVDNGALAIFGTRPSSFDRPHPVAVEMRGTVLRPSSSAWRTFFPR